MIPLNRQVFFSLLYAGLWEQPVQLSGMGGVDFDGLFRVAEEQSVVGLVAAGLEHVVDRKITKPQALPFMKGICGGEPECRYESLCGRPIHQVAGSGHSSGSC